MDVVSGMKAPEDVYILIPTCGSVTLHGQGDLRLQAELKLVTSCPRDAKSILDYPGGHNVITAPSKWRREAGESVSRVALGERLEATTGSEDGRGCEPRDTGGLQMVGQARKDAPLEPPEGTSLAEILILAQ